MPTVLVADDDPDIRDLITFRLERAGYVVKTASNGPGALAAAQAGGVDLAVLDVRMPELSGLQVCQRLRAVPATAATPVILLTTDGLQSAVADGYAVGADDYVIKPFSPRDLAGRVQSLLDRSARRTHAVRAAGRTGTAPLARCPAPLLPGR